jgi:hypothetical protein
MLQQPSPRGCRPTGARRIAPQTDGTATGASRGLQQFERRRAPADFSLATLSQQQQHRRAQLSPPAIAHAPASPPMIAAAHKTAAKGSSVRRNACKRWHKQQRMLRWRDTSISRRAQSVAPR